MTGTKVDGFKKSMWVNTCSNSVTKTLETTFIVVLFLVILFLVLIRCLAIVPLHAIVSWSLGQSARNLPIFVIRKIDIGEFAGTNTG